MPTWADEQLADLRETYAGCWEVWYLYLPKRYTWHARPAGTASATVHADTPEQLADKLGTLICQCPRHAEPSRTE